MSVRQLRLVVTVDDGEYDEVVALYRDQLGLDAEGAYTEPDGGRVSILSAGRATLEITDATHAAYIDRVEVGERVAPKFRLALEVDDAASAMAAAVQAGAAVVAEPVRTPWNSLNARLDTVGGVQLTLFEELDPTT